MNRRTTFLDAPAFTSARPVRRRRGRSALAALALAVATVAGVFTAGSAGAAVLGDLETSFEIDGDSNAENGVDWTDVLDGSPRTGAYVTASGHSSTGILDASVSFDAGADSADCSGGVDDTVFAGGAKIDDPEWAVSAAPEPNAKSDACSAASAYEIVMVDGAAHVILYQYWTRLQGLGDMTTYQILQGPDTATRSDDYLIEFDYDSSGPSTGVRVLAWDGSAWTPITAAFDYEAAVGTNPDTPSTGNAATFGELAIDLTSAGLIDDDACTAYTADGFITRTGNSTQASTEDVLLIDDPLQITTCGTLTVEKRGLPETVSGDAEFDYAVTRSGQGDVHGSLLAGTVPDAVAGDGGLGAGIGLGDRHEWTGVNAAADLTLDETIGEGLPWQHVSTVCRVTDPATGILHVFTDEAFAVYAGATTACIITNTRTDASVTVAKSVTGAPAGFPWAFELRIDPAPAGAAATQVVSSDDATALWSDLEVGRTYTLTEGEVAGWIGGDVRCPGLPDADPDAAGFQFVAAAGVHLECTLANLAIAPTGSVEKTVSARERIDLDTWRITYAVVVTNGSEQFPLTYDLSDEPAFGQGIVIESGSATGPVGAGAEAWDPVGGTTVLATDAVIPAGGTHEYAITIVATVPASAFQSGADVCLPGGADGGFANTALLVVDDETHQATACAPPTPPGAEVPTPEPTPIPAVGPQAPPLASTGTDVRIAVSVAAAFLAAGAVLAGTAMASRRRAQHRVDTAI